MISIVRDREDFTNAAASSDCIYNNNNIVYIVDYNIIAPTTFEHFENQRTPGYVKR